MAVLRCCQSLFDPIPDPRRLHVQVSVLLGPSWHNDHRCVDHDGVLLRLYAGEEQRAEYRIHMRDQLLSGKSSLFSSPNIRSPGDSAENQIRFSRCVTAQVMLSWTARTQLCLSLYLKYDRRCISTSALSGWRAYSHIVAICNSVHDLLDDIRWLHTGLLGISDLF